MRGIRGLKGRGLVDVREASKEPLHKNAGEGLGSLVNLIVVEKPGITFNDIAGLGEAKRAIITAVASIINPELGEGWTGILLYGPPGRARLVLLKATAREFNLSFIYADFSAIMSKWVGKARKPL